MRIIKNKTLVEFGAEQADALQPLLAWHQDVEEVVWETPNDIKLLFRSADIITGK